MRFDLLLFAAICCSLLDRYAAGRMRCARRASEWPPAPKTSRRLAAQWCFANYMRIDAAISIAPGAPTAA
jgi:hypothetical protein